MLKKIPINYISAFVIFMVVILWIFSGAFKNEESENTNISEVTIEELISVRAKNFSSQNKTYFLTVRGRTEADKIVLLKPKTTSTLNYTIDKGRSVASGDIICELDPENRTAALDEANASKIKAQLEYDAIKQLASEGYRSENAVATADAALKASIARVKMATNEVENLKIKAPFDGFIEDVFLEPGDLIAPTTPCAKIMKLNPMIITGEVTEKNVDQVNLKQKVNIKLLDDKEVNGEISFISKSANPSTRTYKIEATIDNSDGKIREGLSADMFVPIREVLAHLIPSYLISLNDKGDLGIKILDENRVQFTKIQIVEDSVKGLWVTGLPENVTIITVGQEYVINGQEVNVQMLN